MKDLEGGLATPKRSMRMRKRHSAHGSNVERLVCGDPSGCGTHQGLMPTLQ